MDEDEGVERLAREVRDADAAVALTGAGVSTASGVPDFRGENGIWNAEFDPDDFVIDRFLSDPAGFWDDRVDLHEAMFPGEIGPNAAHEALADLERAGHLDAVITQNTDGLHGAAGSDDVVELHGNADRVVCADCGRKRDAEPVRERARDGDLPPRCECGGPLRPDVVLFGESLPEGGLAEARRRAEESDIFLAVGSSLSVEPAASLPRLAARDGTLAIVNLDTTPHDGAADVVVRADVTDALPALGEAVRTR